MESLQSAFLPNKGATIMDYDYLTGLYTMRYMKHNYREYCSNYDKVYMIAVDFAKLKHINDHFGHEEGDNCLKLFAVLARKYFQDAILSRRSGDEFVFLCHISKEEIEKLLIEMDQEIEDMYHEKKMKVRFGFNSGIKFCNYDYYETLKKADYTMYYAKDNQELYHFYEESISQKVAEKQEFINHIDELCISNSFKLAYQFIYTIAGKDVDISEVYARDEEYKSIFTPELYQLLKINHRFHEIDWYIINYIFKTHDVKYAGYRVMINIHYQTVIMQGNEFLIRMKKAIKKYNINVKDFVFSICVNEFDYDLNKLFYTIEELKKLGFGICLDSYDLEDCGIIINAISKIEVDYVKIKKEFLLQMMHRSRKQIIARHLISMLFEMNIQPIFSCVETKEQKDFITKLDKNCLAKGNYFHKTQNAIKRDAE